MGHDQPPKQHQHAWQVAQVGRDERVLVVNCSGATTFAMAPAHPPALTSCLCRSPRACQAWSLFSAANASQSASSWATSACSSCWACALPACVRVCTTALVMRQARCQLLALRPASH